MADIDDRWHVTVKGEDGKPRKVRTARYGKGARWDVRWRDDAGRQRHKAFAKRSDAERELARITSELATGTYIDPKAGRRSFKAYAEEWRAGLTADAPTVETVTRQLRLHVYPVIGDRPLGVLARRPSLVQQWVKGLEGDLQPSTIRSIVGWVSAVFNAAVDDGVIHRNPFATRSVRAPKVEPRQVEPWDLARVEAVAAALPSRYAPMVYLGAGCGHRQGELFGVALDDVDFLGRTVHVRRQVRIIGGTLVFAPPKGGKTREVPLPDTVGMSLSAHLRDVAPAEVTLPWRTPDGAPVTAALLFSDEEGKPLRRQTFNRAWRAALKAAGVPLERKNGCHVLRHTAASAWLAAGVDVRTVAEYLGHADPGFTLRTYAHLMPDAADRARRAMDAFFAESSCAPNVRQGGA